MEKRGFSHKLILFFSGMDGGTAYLAILGVLFICGLGVPIPEDITLISAGILAALGKISFTGALIVGFIGVMLGDAFLFFVGRIYGRKVFKWPMIRTFATPERIKKAEVRIQSNARFICFVARFLPGLRSVVFLTAGTMGIRPIVFFTQDGLAALLSVPLWVWFGWFFGNNIDELLVIAKQLQIYFIIGVVLLIGGYLFYRWRKRRSQVKT